MVVKFDIRGFFPDDVEGDIGEIIEANIYEAVRHGALESMILFDQRLSRITKTWRDRNKPYFRSNISIKEQLGVKDLDKDGIEFYLENTRIWNWLDRGTRPHKIYARKRMPSQVGRGRSGYRIGGGILAFTGWSDKIGSAGTFERQVKERVGKREFKRKGGGSALRSRDTRLLGRFRSARRSGSFPPTYLASTLPSRITSNKSEHLGDKRRRDGNPVVVMPYFFQGRAYVDHPGVEARHISQRLFYGSETNVGIEERFIASVYDRLNDLEDRTIFPVNRRHVARGSLNRRQKQIFTETGQRILGKYNIRRFLEAEYNRGRREF